MKLPTTNNFFLLTQYPHLITNPKRNSTEKALTLQLEQYFTLLINQFVQISICKTMHSQRKNEPSIVKDFEPSSKKELQYQAEDRKGTKGPQNSDALTELLTVFKQFLNFNKMQCSRGEEQRPIDLSQLEPRDRNINMAMPKGDLTQESLQKFISKLCKMVWSRAFHYYSTEQLSYEYVKIYSSQQILRNIVRLSQRHQLTSKHFQIMNMQLQQKLLEYEMAKYPITQSQEVNRNVNNSIREIDNTDQPINDYLFNSSVCFKFRDSGEYNDLIMILINEILTKIENRVGNKTVYEKFEERMERLFDSVLDEDSMKEAEQEKLILDECESRDNLELINHKYSISQDQFKKELIKIKVKDKEKYRLKVQEYTSYKIARKLPESTRHFTENEILSHNLKIENPQVLRMLTKWCDELENKFTTPNYFEHYIETLKLEGGKFLVLILNEVKEGLDQLMAEQYRDIKAELHELAKNNYFMQSQLLFHELKSVKSNEIEKYESIAAKYSIDIVNNLHSYTLAYLNRLIHGLLTVAMKFTKLPSVHHFEWPSNINLITFQINDLVRCRCASGQREIIKIYNQILKLCDSDKFKMIKVSNRLKRGTHDVVMTVKYRQIICEIQLSVTNKRHKFAEYSNMFNHYLYELKRSVFGPLTEMCNIWKSIDGRFNVYKNLSRERSAHSTVKLEHECQNKNEYETYYKPFICNSCEHHYYHNNYIKHHFKCKYCSFWLCARCQLDLSDCRSMITAAYKEDEIINRCNRLKRKGNAAIPDYGICIFIESQSTKVEPFRKYVNQNQTSIIGIKNKVLYRIYDISTEEDKLKFKEDFLVFEIGEAYGKRHIKIDEEKIGEFFVSEKLMAIYEKNKEKICLNYDNIKNEQFINLCKLGSTSQKENIKRLEIIGNKLESVSPLASNFKNVKILEMGKNSISNFEEIQKLEKLEILCVNQNKVKQFPIEVCHLWNLKQLSFCENEIKLLPDDLNKLHRLKVLKLSNNLIQQFPKCISQFFYLNELNLKNNLIKEIPSLISSLNQLEVLDLESNQISAIHNDFSKLTSLESLNLSFNLLTELPVCITSIKALQRCNLRNNKICEISMTINQLLNLVYLNLSNNQIVSFPSINQLTKLIELNLNYNSIESLSQFQSHNFSIKFLFVSHNSIRKLQSLHNLIHLEELYLNNNYLEVLPESLGRLEKLEILHLESNEVTHICDFKLEQLKYLNLSQNKLSAFTNMDLICAEEIDLSSNCLSDFSTNLLPCLKRMNLNNNVLQSIDLCNYPKLKYFFANMNKLQHFPKVQEKNHIKIMNLEHNFIKSVPASIVHFHNIAQLNLAYNQITIVPKEIQSLSSLKDHSLDLSHNPIEKIENPQFTLKKGTHLTVEELKPMLSMVHQSSKSSITDQPPLRCDGSKSGTIEKI